MNNELQYVNLQDFKELNLKNIELFHDSFSKIITDSISEQTLESMKSVLEMLSHNYEKIYNSLSLDDTKNAVCYYFGRISSMTDISLDLLKENTTSKLLHDISKNYSHLLPALKIISEHGTISGSNLKKELNFKHDSSLSNFIKRIDKYNLIEVNKIGTSNYYTLTLLGKRLLSDYSNQQTDYDAEIKICFNDLLRLLNGIIEEIEKENPAALNIIYNYIDFEINTSKKRLLKQKLDTIFTIRNKFFYDRIRNAVNSLALEEDIYDNYNSDGDSNNKIYSYDRTMINSY